MGEIMEQPRVAKLEWAEVRSENYDRLVRFYHETLRLPIVFEEEDKNYIQFQVGKSDTYLAILKTRRKDRNFIPAIEVTDLDRAIEELRSKGVKFVSEVDEGEHVRLIDFEDPDGNRLQLFEFKKGREH